MGSSPWSNKMTSRLLVSASVPGRLSGCALAFLTVLSPAKNHVWASQYQFAASSNTGGIRMSSTGTPSFTVAQFPCRSDNYGFLLHDPVTGDTCAIDTPCAKSYRRVLNDRGWKLTHIFNTHHHHDHQGGNLELKSDGVTITGPKAERTEIAGMDKAVVGGDDVQFGNFKARVLDAGGHTHGHIAFYFPDQSMLFSGDCLFSLGCGRMFEGTHAQFWASLERFRNLPDDTVVYWYVICHRCLKVPQQRSDFGLTLQLLCSPFSAHEYTESNGKFALSIEPNNQDLVDRMAIVKSKRARGEATVPFVLGEDKKANPFLRADLSSEIQKNVGIGANDSPSVAFGKVRKAKDKF